MGVAAGALDLLYQLLTTNTINRKRIIERTIVLKNKNEILL
jgi:hypothetical protein